MNRVKSLLVLLALMAVGAFAQTESDFEVKKGSKSVTITKYVGKGGTVNIPQQIQNLPVTIIGESAFQNNTTITSVSIPNSVETIRFIAFAGCTNLTSVTIGSGVTSIATGAFEQCNKLTSIIIPKNVGSIGTAAFVQCDNLTSVTFQGTSGDTDFEASAFPGDLRTKYVAGGAGTYTKSGNAWTKQGTATQSASQYNPESDFEVTKSGNAITITKYKGTATVVNIPNTIQNTPVTAIGNQAFKNTAITSLSIPASVTSLGGGFLQNCTSLNSITFGSKIPVGANTFLTLGDLYTKFVNGGAGTYTRQANGTTWTKK